MPVPKVIVITKPFWFLPAPNSMTPMAAASASLTIKNGNPNLDLNNASSCVP